MTRLRANASLSERRYRIELTVKIKELTETLLIGGRSYDSLLIANASSWEKKERIELAVKLMNFNETLVIGGSNYHSLYSEW